MPITPSTWNGLETLAITTAAFELQVATAFGPRLCSLSIGAKENMLFWAADPEAYTRRSPARDESWYLRGGHRVWLSRGLADESEETYFPDNQPSTFSVDGDCLEIWGAEDPINRVQRGLRIEIIDEQRLQVDNVVKNNSDMLFSAGIWALTCTLPSADCQYLIPLGDDSSFNTATITLFKEWAGHGQKTFADDQFVITDDCMVLTPGAKENKRMLNTAASCLALNDRQRDVALLIKTDYEPQATYPANANIALYVGNDNFMVEMETMGALACVKPGQTLSHRQYWYMQNQALSDCSAATIKQLY